MKKFISKAIRSGSWYSYADSSRSAYHDLQDVWNKNNYIGFRIVIKKGNEKTD
jgi:formylglycine-generating enzyme required for sulfatase activity